MQTFNVTTEAVGKWIRAWCFNKTANSLNHRLLQECHGFDSDCKATTTDLHQYTEHLIYIKKLEKFQDPVESEAEFEMDSGRVF